MKELRCLVFTDQEVARAVLDRRRRINDPLPVGTVTRIVFDQNAGPEHDSIETRLFVTDDDGTVSELVLTDIEVTAALVAYCMGRRIPLPVASDKMLYLINGALTLMITMNFNKAPRLVVASGATDGPEAGAGAESKTGKTPGERMSPRRRIGR